MRIVIDRPPIYDEIAARFPIAGKAIIFAWGDVIFNPKGIHIDGALMAHESVHARRQGSDIVGWWRRYIDEASFRLAEEIPAHQAEYQARLKSAANRQQRRGCLKLMASRLASPIYGGVITTSKAASILGEAA